MQHSVTSKDRGNIKLSCVFPILYCRISGGAASDKNIKENVCAQIEKNFARAKWKVSSFVLSFRELFFAKFNSSCAVLERGGIAAQCCVTVSWGRLMFSQYVFRLERQSEIIFVFLLQKAVRVTTIMKRLRAPEHSNSRATTPAAGAPVEPAAPQATIDPSAPLCGETPEGAPAAATELPAEAEMSHPAPEASPGASASPSEGPAQQEAEPASRCNGEASTTHQASVEAEGEQG